MSNISVKIDEFEGPLDLLLHLIKELEVDIYDIPISEVTSQYIDYLKKMQELNLEIAGEFLVMASTLMSIKSNMLIPRKNYPEELDADEESVEESKEYLTALLLEYQLVKEASILLDKKRREREKVYSKEAHDLSKYQENIPLQNDAYTVRDIIQATFRVLKKERLQEQPTSWIERDEISISDKMEEIKFELSESSSREPTEMMELIKNHSREEVVAVFLAVLELMKTNQIFVLQEENYGAIWINENKSDVVK